MGALNYNDFLNLAGIFLNVGTMLQVRKHHMLYVPYHRARPGPLGPQDSMCPLMMMLTLIPRRFRRGVGHRWIVLTVLEHATRQSALHVFDGCVVPGVCLVLCACLCVCQDKWLHEDAKVRQQRQHLEQVNTERMCNLQQLETELRSQIQSLGTDLTLAGKEAERDMVTTHTHAHIYIHATRREAEGTGELMGPDWPL